MEVTGVQSRNCYQIYYVDTNNLFFKKNSLCIIETEQGIDLGRISKCLRHTNCIDAEISGKLLRKATNEDLKKLPEIESIEKNAFEVCRGKSAEKKLEMKLISVKCLFDKTKIIFYFVAENRIDFRELVRDLASIFRTRIEMRQIGVRDEARLLGGFGPCGRQLCCVNLKDEFEPVSIKMAKEQNLNLNSLKISGMCGRLLCCLGYEYNVYKKLNRKLPKPGAVINAGDRKYTVESVNIFTQEIKIRNNESTIDITNNDLIRDKDTFSISRETLKNIQERYEDDSDEQI